MNFLMQANTATGSEKKCVYEIELKKGELMVLNNRAISTPDVTRAELIVAK